MRRAGCLLLLLKWRALAMFRGRRRAGWHQCWSIPSDPPQECPTSALAYLGEMVQQWSTQQFLGNSRLLCNGNISARKAGTYAQCFLLVQLQSMPCVYSRLRDTLLELRDTCTFATAAVMKLKNVQIIKILKPQKWEKIATHYSF